jgi:dethiobiotin synthetase
VSAPRFVVVTGTDTGVGKTLVTAGLARAAVHAGLRVVAVKPAESGCAPGTPSAEEDGCVLAAATGQAAPRAALVRLRDPVTPALAAERESVALDLEALAASIEQLSAGADLVLVEGAGGLLAPIGWDWDATTLARRLGASVLIVAADRLGTLNHVHLTARCLAEEKLPSVGVVLSAPATADTSTGTNAVALRRRLSPFGALAARIAELPRVAGPEAAAAHLGPVVSWLAGGEPRGSSGANG